MLFWMHACTHRHKHALTHTHTHVHELVPHDARPVTSRSCPSKSRTASEELVEEVGQEEEQQQEREVVVGQLPALQLPGKAGQT